MWFAMRYTAGNRDHTERGVYGKDRPPFFRDWYRIVACFHKFSTALCGGVFQRLNGKLRFWLGRKIDAETRAAAQTTCHINPATMLMNNSGGDGKSHSFAASFRAEEWFKQPRQVFRGDSRTGIQK